MRHRLSTLDRDSDDGNSHVDVVPLHDAAQVLVVGEDPVEPVVVDVRHDHLDKRKKHSECRGDPQTGHSSYDKTLTFSAGTPDRTDSDAHRSEM